MGKFTITQSPDVRDIYLYPESNGCVNECFPVGDMPNWRCVDDLHNALEPETTHVWMEGASTISELYAMENHGTETGSINYVKAYCKAQSDTYAPHVDAVYKVGLSQNSDCSLFAHSNNMPLCTGYGLFGYAWMDNPWTATNWTWDEVDALQQGFECSSPSVIVSPFPMLPIDDGDRIDITSVTTGYEHWEAVELEKPYSEVFESGAAWKYDLYQFIKASNNPLTYSDATRGHLFHNNYMFACSLADGLYIHKLNDDNKFEFILRQNDGKSYNDIATDGTYYYVTTNVGTYIYSFDGETLTEITHNAIGAQIVYCYGDYIYVGETTNINAYTFDGTTFTSIDTQVVNGNVAGIYHDGSYIYVSTSSGMLYAMSFNGTVFAIIDSDNKAFLLGENLYGIDGDGTYIYAPAMTRGVYAYSFDGVTLTFVAGRDDGNTYKSLACYNGYIFIPTDGANDELIVYTFDGVAFSAIIDTYTFGPNAHTMWEVNVVDGIVICDWTSMRMLTFSGAAFGEFADTAEDNTPPYLDDNIVSVTVIAKMGKDLSAEDQADIRGCFNIKTGGIEFNTSADYYTLETKQRYYAYTWTENPNTLAAWTLAEIQALQAGIGLYGTGTKYATCSRCYIVLGATTSVSPKINTCQSYLKVNYSPDDTVCVMPKPQEISTNHARNTKMMNFWDGEREVYDLNRSGKSMVLAGTIVDRHSDEPDWCDADYAYRKKITIDHTQVDADLVDFPVLISVNLAKKCLNSSGYDIMFCNDSCTEYVCDIENYDSAGNLKAWVKVPSVSSTVDTVFWIYYKKADVTVNPTSETVWDNYSMVQHMTDKPDATHIEDSTSNSNDGTKIAANEPGQINARIHKSQRGDGVNDIITIADDPTVNFPPADSGTVSFWVRTDTLQVRDIVIKRYWSGGVYHWWFIRQGVGAATWKLWSQFKSNDGVTGDNQWDTAQWGDLEDGKWHYVTVVINRAGVGDNVLRAYFDGDFEVDASTVIGNPDCTWTDPLWIFKGSLSGGVFDGDVDEVRISKVVLSDEWIKAEYANQKENSTFISYGIRQENYVTYINACTQIICVRNMTRDGTIVTIGGLNPVYFNGDYRINQFGWKKISEKPENYEWILQLESAN
jgi:hypothetical protein